MEVVNYVQPGGDLMSNAAPVLEAPVSGKPLPRQNGLKFLREHHSPQRAHTALRMALGLPVGQAAV